MASNVITNVTLFRSKENVLSVDTFLITIHKSQIADLDNSSIRKDVLFQKAFL